MGKPSDTTPTNEPVISTGSGDWPDGEPESVRLAADAEQIMARILDFGRRRGEMPMYAVLRVTFAHVDDQIDEDEALRLVAEVKAGRWREVVDLLDEIGGSR
ncbi:hypothetical protein ACFOY4_33525 [Actinomadura syzygii]|uniref:Uncharacterized protein n=1 Tax=Actinomadura syzygii TaxID=1427538 RepID=A0A5D0UA97_9ACTN|nr:hypothetical protein [Actinomadura syzygii]TYC15017.1 hypothetical protein FXF65_12885 [Actinomadura syzygii]